MMGWIAFIFLTITLTVSNLHMLKKSSLLKMIRSTLPETKMAPKTGWLEYCSRFLLGQKAGLFSGAFFLLVSGRVNR